MKRRAIAVGVTALLIGVPLLAERADAPAPSPLARPAQPEQVAAEAERCGAACQAAGVPIFVPPNRGSVPTRIGGGARGGAPQRADP